MADLVERVADSMERASLADCSCYDDLRAIIARAAIAEVLDWIANPPAEWPEGFRAYRKAIAAELRKEALC